jgi:hypothetical protein
MDPLDPLRALPDGVTCTVCEDRVPAERVRLLAWRDDLAFLQIDCASCRSTTLGFVMAETPVASSPKGDPISSDDVLDMHEFLARWHGDLDGLMTPPGSGDEREIAGQPPRNRGRGPSPRP